MELGGLLAELLDDLEDLDGQNVERGLVLAERLLNGRALGDGEAEVLRALDGWGVLVLEQALVRFELLLILINNSVG